MLGNDLGVQRMLTEAFISTQPINITLVPMERQKTASGGYTFVAGAPRASQVMRLVEPASVPDPLRAADGTQREVDFMLIGAFDAEMAVYDMFIHGGNTWRIESLYPDNGWERRAVVVRT